MGNFYTWEEVLAVKGIKKAVLKYAIDQGEIDEGGKLPKDEGELQDLFERAISEAGENVFYFSGDGREQVSSHLHYQFAGVYFEFDGHDGITGPLDDNDPEGMIDLCEYHLGDDEPRDGYLVSIGGEFPDEYFTQRCLKLVKIGHELEINNNQYIRTKEGFAPKK
jgi:hypothetical protein